MGGVVGAGTTGGVVVGSAVGAAAGSAASQGVAIALDIQDHFSWKAVGSAALSGLIAPALPGGELGLTDWGTVVNAAVGSAVNQGVNIALGLQDSFNWAAVAASAVAAPVAKVVGDKVGGAVGGAVGSAAVGDFANRFTRGVINQVAYATFTGGQLNYVQMAADAFGNALGNAIGDRIKPTRLGITAKQWAEVDQQLASANQGAFND